MSEVVEPLRPSSLQDTGRLVIEDREHFEFLVSRQAFTNPVIFANEREKIFEKCWLYVAHESELRKNNDFVTRNVAGRELLIARDRKGSIHAFYNTCPHRGAIVEREKSGNRLGFKCFYHGWGFNNNGEFATKYEIGDYPENFNRGGCKNLKSVARLENYRGLLFINYDSDAGSLSDYLADAKHYLDLILDQAPDGMEICGGIQEYSIRANWKLLAENSVDGYHGMPTHQTYFEYLFNKLEVTAEGFKEQARLAKLPGSGAFDLGNGHAVITSRSGPATFGRPVAHWIPEWGEEARLELEARQDKLIAAFGEERTDKISAWNRNLVIFPNLVINDLMAVTLRTFYPLAPDLMNISAWSLAPKDESALMRQNRLENYLEFLGPGGFATPDDQEALESAQRGYRNAKVAGFNDISRGMMRDQPRKDDEEQMRCFWREWSKRVEAPAQEA